MNRKWFSSGTVSSLPKIIIAIFSLTILSALLFIFLVNRLVYDDHYHIVDASAYAHSGVSVSTIRAQRNPPGPGSYIWMAAGIRLLNGAELRSGRLAILSGWILLVIGILAFAPYGSIPQLWYGALLATLVFPYSLTATATLLTEGPSLFFAILGTLAWTEAVSRPTVTSKVFGLGMLGGLGIGAAIICRQYYIALLPAAAVLTLYLLRQRASEDRPLWLASAAVSVTVAVIPLLLLAAVWRNLSSPGMATGTSYPRFHAGLGLNFLKPLVAAFCTGFYLIPFTFPAMKCIHSGRRWKALLAAAMIGVAAVPFRIDLVNLGILHAVLKFASRAPAAGIAAFLVIAILIAYNAIAVSLLLWDKRQEVLRRPAVLFALLTVLFFVMEQLGVGGNIPFYDRYILQLAPFLGLIAFFLIPAVTFPRAVVLTGMYLLSQGILWRALFLK
jgi:hypothetical protein